MDSEASAANVGTDESLSKAIQLNEVDSNDGTKTGGGFVDGKFYT